MALAAISVTRQVAPSGHHLFQRDNFLAHTQHVLDNQFQMAGLVEHVLAEVEEA